MGASKIYSKIMTEWVNETSKIMLHEQSGLGKVRSCIDNIFTLEKMEKKEENLMNTYNVYCFYKSFC
jgi:hypothetical protein